MAEATALHAVLAQVTEGRTSGLRADVTFRLAGDLLEYEIAIENPLAVNLSEATIVTRADSGGQRTVGFLFWDLRSRERLVELRGTAVAPTGSAALAEWLLARPQDFEVVLSEADGNRQWRGPIRRSGR